MHKKDMTKEYYWLVVDDTNAAIRVHDTRDEARSYKRGYLPGGRVAKGTINTCGKFPRRTWIIVKKETGETATVYAYESRKQARLDLLFGEKVVKLDFV